MFGPVRVLCTEGQWFYFVFRMVYCCCLVLVLRGWVAVVRPLLEAVVLFRIYVGVTITHGYGQEDARGGRKRKKTIIKKQKCVISNNQNAVTLSK